MLRRKQRKWCWLMSQNTQVKLKIKGEKMDRQKGHPFGRVRRDRAG